MGYSSLALDLDIDLSAHLLGINMSTDLGIESTPSFSRNLPSLRVLNYRLSYKLKPVVTTERIPPRY